MKERSHSNVMLVMQHFFHKGHLNWHIALVHEGKQPFKCNDCDAIFFTKQNMNGHIKFVYEGKKPFKCNICESNFSQNFLNRHLVPVDR